MPKRKVIIELLDFLCRESDFFKSFMNILILSLGKFEGSVYSNSVITLLL